MAGKGAAAGAAGGGGEAKEEAGTKLVELPERQVRWILEQELRPVFSLDDFSDDPVTSEVLPQKFLDKHMEHLASARESLLASQDEFAEYQAWVREAYERDGRVMVPEDVYPQIDEAQEELNRVSMQEEVDLIFKQAAEEFEREYPELVALIAEFEGKTDEDGNPLCGTAPPQLQL